MNKAQWKKLNLGLEDWMKANMVDGVPGKSPLLNYRGTDKLSVNISRGGSRIILYARKSDTVTEINERLTDFSAMLDAHWPNAFRPVMIDLGQDDEPRRSFFRWLDRIPSWVFWELILLFGMFWGFTLGLKIERSNQEQEKAKLQNRIWQLENKVAYRDTIIAHTNPEGGRFVIDCDDIIRRNRAYTKKQPIIPDEAAVK